MPHARQLLGDRGEAIAEQFLAQRGYHVLARKYRCPYGEIDLICRDASTLVFVEVKTRRGSAFGAPEEAITRAKIVHLSQSAEHYLAAQQCSDAPWRIDVVSITLDPSGKPVETRLICGIGEW